MTTTSTTSLTTSTGSNGVTTVGGLISGGIDITSVISGLTQVAQVPITKEQTLEQGLNDKLTAWQNLNIQLASLQTAASALTLAGTYSATSGTSSNTTVASITSQANATVGDHSLTVNSLAQATKIVSNTVSTGSTALGKAGTFSLNGKSIAILSTDSLTDISVKINAAGAGVSANVVNVGPNNFRMTLSGTATGTANQISAVDNTGTLLNDLGLVSSAGAVGIRQTITSGSQFGAGSIALSSASQSFAAALGIKGTPPSGTVTIGGQSIAIDLSTDSLNSVAAKINAAGATGVSAQVVATNDGTNRQQLQIMGVNASSVTDSGNVLATLGITQSAYTNTLTSAADSNFTLDGLTLTRSTNVVNDAVPGATVKLLSDGSSTLSVSQDTSAISTAVTNFVSAYNSVQDNISAQNIYVPDTTAAAGTAQTSPPLFGDTMLSNIQHDLNSTLSAISGNNTLESIGITLNANNDLLVDQSTLTSSLQADPSQVFNLFGRSGLSSNTDVGFVSASVKTQSSIGAGYAINITQPATQAQIVSPNVIGSTVATASTDSETLTFTGKLFPSSASITIPTGSTLESVISQINNDASLNGQVYASRDTAGHLVLASNSFGAGNGFSVQSNETQTGKNTSGFTAASATAATDGTDVAGTINGEAATGSGQVLTGNAGNATTEGLTLFVTATSAGSYGNVSVTHGVADAIGTAITSILDPTNGPLFTSENSLTAQIQDTQTQIQSMQTQLTTYTSYLQQIFTDMETRVSELQAQGSAFAAQVAGLSNSK